MYHLKKKILLLICPQLFLASLYAGPKNIALGKILEYDPKPTFRRTVHSRDPYLLTDGIKAQKIQPETMVGWERERLIKIRIDLGRVYKVGTINIHTVGGGLSYVEYPEYVVAISSLNGRQYRFSGFSTTDGWELAVNKSISRELIIPVEQEAQYIELFVRSTDIRFLADEIEVMESQFPELNKSPDNYIDEEKIIDLVERARQFQRDSDVLFGRIDQFPVDANDFENDLQDVKGLVSQLSTNVTESRISLTESRLASFKSRYFKLRYGIEWMCYLSDPMNILRYGDLPPELPDDPQVSLYQWRNEYGVASLNLVNCSNSPITFQLNISPLNLNGKTIDSKTVFELRRALYVQVYNAGLVADPLVLQNSKPFRVVPGETVQIWLEANSKELQSGKYTAALAISAEGQNINKIIQTIPIKLEVADKIFSEAVSRLPLLTCNWPHITSSDRFTSKNPKLIKSAIGDLKDHYTNVFVLRLDAIFGPDRKGLSLQKLDNELNLRRQLHPFVLFDMMGQRGIHGGHLEKMFGSFRTKVWETNFRSYLKRFRDYMLSNGYDYDQFALYPYDEYIGDDFVYVAKVIRDFDPRLKIYANKWFESERQFREIKGLIDIWCPYFFQVLDDKRKFDYYKESGDFDRVWCYTTHLYYERFYAPPSIRNASRWHIDKKELWRTSPITAVSLGMTGVGFWTYQDVYRNDWSKDEFNNYGVIYDGSHNPDRDCQNEPIIPSKSWQQWRQGVEDAVCLMGHKELLDEFYTTPNARLSSEYLTSLRKRADGKAD